MSKYEFGSIINRDFRNNLNRLGEEVEVHGKTIHDLVAEGQLTPEQYAELINVIEGHLKSGDVGASDLNKELQGKINQISDKISKGEVTANDFNKNGRLLDGTFFTTEFIQNLNDGEIVTTNVLPRSITKKELADKSVTHEKVSFIEETTDNFVDRERLVEGYYLESSDNVFEGSDWGYSDYYLAVAPGESIATNHVTRLNFYNGNIELIESVAIVNGAEKITTVPINAHFMRFNMRLNRNEAQINKSDQLLPFSKYTSPILKGVKAFEKIEKDDIPDNLIDSDKVSFIKSTSNLFFKSSAKKNVNITNDGEYQEHHNFLGISDFIKVTPGELISIIHINKISLFDADKEFSGYHGQTPRDEHALYAIPKGIHYIIVGVFNNDFERAQINRGTELLPYEEGHYYISDSIKEKRENNLDLWQEDRFVVEGALRGNFTGEEVTYKGSYYTLDEFYGLYDGLVDDYPEYITKTLLKNDDAGNPIYRYDFKPPKVNSYTNSNSRVDTKFPKMILISSIHGDEKTSCYNLYNALRQIAESWRNNELLETLRWNVHFIVVPAANPQSYIDHSKVNENGVDICRNFPDGWQVSDQPVGQKGHSGPGPASEISTQEIIKILKENKDDTIYFGSFHDFWETERFIWNASGTKLQVQLGKQLVSKMTRKWQKEYDWMPQEEDFYFGYSNTSHPGGTESFYGASLGIQSSIFENSARVGFSPDDNMSGFTKTSLTLGSETIINWLVMNLRENVKFYNSLN